MADDHSSSSNRIVLLLIGGIPLTVILAATWLWYFGERGDLDVVGLFGTANRGVLVRPPRQLDDLPLRDSNGRATRFADLEPRWAILVPGANGSCNEQCEKNLYVTRQIHVALGKDFGRLRRLYISETSVDNTPFVAPALTDKHPVPANEDFATYLATEHRGLKALTLNEGGYATLFGEHAADQSTWYLVDPAGWIMMSYNSEIPYKDAISDLKFLLKNSGG